MLFTFTPPADTAESIPGLRSRSPDNPVPTAGIDRPVSFINVESAVYLFSTIARPSPDSSKSP